MGSTPTVPAEFVRAQPGEGTPIVQVVPLALWMIPLRASCRRNLVNVSYPERLPQPFVINEEEGLIFLDRATGRGTKLVAMKGSDDCFDQRSFAHRKLRREKTSTRRHGYWLVPDLVIALITPPEVRPYSAS